MSGSINRRLARGIGAAVVATAASATLAVGTAGASTQATPLAGITVRGDPTAAPAGFVASLEGRNEVTGGDRVGQALELIGIEGNRLSYSVSWRGMSTPTEAAIHAAGRGVDGPVVVPLFTTRSSGGSSASGSVTVSD